MACLQERKRRFSEDEEMSEASPTRSFVTKHQLQQRNKNDCKRNKTGLFKRTPLNLKLATMDKDKLLQVLSSLLETQSDLKHDILAYIPAPTIPSALAVLNDIEKNFQASFPYNKNGPRRDQYTFSRVRESLLDLIDTITQYTHHFVSASIFPTTCFTYLDQVTHFAHRLPTWDADQHNQPRLDLYTDLALFWKQAIQLTYDKITKESNFNSDTIALWAKNLAHHNTLSNGLLDTAIHEFNQCFLSSPSPTPLSSLTTTSSTSTSTSTSTSLPLTSTFSALPYHHQYDPINPNTVSPALCHSSPATALDISPSPVVGYADLRR